MWGSEARAGAGTIVRVPRDVNKLKRLAEELAALSSEERARVIAEATPARRLRPLPRGFRPPVLEGGARWIGGALRRSLLYDDGER